MLCGFRRHDRVSTVAFRLVIASFCPTMRFSSVDLPALGAPANVTIPARVIQSSSGGRQREAERREAHSLTQAAGSA
jgi:hypothetical protein